MVDIYQQWCGPCTGMVSNLKKIRNDIGDDLLKYAAVSCMRNVQPMKIEKEKFPVCWCWEVLCLLMFWTLKCSLHDHASGTTIACIQNVVGWLFFFFFDIHLYIAPGFTKHV